MGQDSYILLFLLLIVDYFVLSLVDSPRWGSLLHIVPITLSVLLGLHTSGARPRTIRFAVLILGFLLAASIAQVFADDHQAGATALFLATFILAITPLSILGRVLRHRHVNIETLFGAVDVYILIGLFFSNLYLAIDAASVHPFFAQSGTHPNSDYVYFSFIVLTTVGFGDLTPLTELARTVVVLEALLGQIFLVTLVARLVSLFGLEKPELGIQGLRRASEVKAKSDPFENPEDP